MLADTTREPISWVRSNRPSLSGRASTTSRGAGNPRSRLEQKYPAVVSSRSTVVVPSPVRSSQAVRVQTMSDPLGSHGPGGPAHEQVDIDGVGETGVLDVHGGAGPSGGDGFAGVGVDQAVAGDQPAGG